MPLYHCSKCHHEWEGGKLDVWCNWCKCSEPGYVLEEITQFEQFCKDKGFWQAWVEKLKKDKLLGPDGKAPL